MGSEKIVRSFRGVRRGALLGFGVAEHLAISDVARVFGLRTSAIRYYEQIGILPPATRPRGRVHPGGNTRAIFRVPARDASAETLAPTLPTKNRGTPGPDEAA